MLSQQTGGTWSLLGDDGYLYRFDSLGKLTSVTSANSDVNPGAPTYNYVPMPDWRTTRLSWISDPFGRQINFGYDSTGRLVSSAIPRPTT